MRLPRLLSLSLSLLFGLALAAQEPAVQPKPLDLKKLRAEAVAAVQDGDFATAAAAFQKLTDADAKDAEAWHMLGYSLHGAGRLDEALVAHRKAAEFPATKAAATYNIACVHALKGQRDEAFAWLDKAVAAGFQDAGLAGEDPDLASLHGDERFATFVGKLKAAQATPQVNVYQQVIERKNARIAFFGRRAGAGQLAIDWSPVPWKSEFGEQLAAGKFVGQRWRLGADFWTRLDTSLDLRFGEVPVPIGYYYLTLEQRAGDQFVLALHDPVAIRKQKLDPFQAQQARGGIEIPMQHTAGGDVAGELAIELVMREGSKTDGTLAIRFGGHRLEAPFHVELPPPATK